MLTKPICIIGAARSGTTLLGRLLSRHPDVALWNEPKYLWRYQNPTVPHDKRTRDDATAHVRQYIRAELAEYVDEENASRLVEKTPSNCFRVPFVHAVLPEARFVHLIRDGRDAAVSAWEQWKLVNDEHEDPNEDGSTRRLIKNAWTRLQADDVPVRDLPYYAVRFARSMLRSVGLKSGSTSTNTWGPEFPGIQKAAQAHDLLEVCALQWRESVQAAREGLRSVPEEQQLELRFETLVRHPADVLRRVFDFADLPGDSPTIKHAENEVHPDAAERWRGRDAHTIQRVMDKAGDLIHELDAPVSDKSNA